MSIYLLRWKKRDSVIHVGAVRLVVLGTLFPHIALPAHVFGLEIPLPIPCTTWDHSAVTLINAFVGEAVIFMKIKANHSREDKILLKQNACQGLMFRTLGVLLNFWPFGHQHF